MSMHLRPPLPLRGPRLLAGAAALGLLLGACTSAAATPTPSPSAPPSAVGASTVPSSDPSPSASIKPSPSPKITQTETAWGRIWDAVPVSIPVPAGGLPITADHPVSAAWSVSGADAATVKDELRSGLASAGYTTDVQGPLEDGTYIIDSVGKPDACHVQTRVTPLGTTLTVTVMFGAACPFR